MIDVYKIKVKMSLDTVYMMIVLSEMYSRTNPTDQDTIATLVQLTMRSGLETIRQASESDLISLEIFQHEMSAALNNLFTNAVVDEFFKAFRSKELVYYTTRSGITASDIQTGINTLESFFKEAYSKLPAEAIH